MIARIIEKVGEGHKLSQDAGYVSLENRTLKVAVLDWANNLAGITAADEEIALLRGEPSGTIYDGGVIGATLARSVVVDSNKVGKDLIDAMNLRIRNKYIELGINNFERDPMQRFAGYVLHILASQERLIITSTGDVRVAADGKIVAGRSDEVELFNIKVRQMLINEGKTDLVTVGKIINYLLCQQYKYQNVAGHRFSYYCVDGTDTPAEGIVSIETKTPQRLLLWSDGYESPDEFTIEGLERKLEHILRVDPLRAREFPGIKSKKDDRTAIEILFDDNWSSLEIKPVPPIL